MFKHFYTLIMAVAMLCCAQTAAAADFGSWLVENLHGTGSERYAVNMNPDWNNYQAVFAMDLTNCVAGTEENLFSLGKGDGTDNDCTVSSSNWFHVYFTNGETPTFRFKIGGGDEWTYTPAKGEIDLSHVLFSFCSENGLRVNSKDVCWNETTNRGYRGQFGNANFYTGATNWKLARRVGNGPHATFLFAQYNYKTRNGVVELYDDGTFIDRNSGENTDKRALSGADLYGRFSIWEPYKIMRTFEANEWYTITFPFDVNFNSAFANNGAFNGAVLRELDRVDDNVVKFKAKTEGAIQFAKPYLIKTTRTITNPQITQRINCFAPTTSTDPNGSGIQFVPTWAPKELATNGTELFLGDGNKFYKPTETDKTMPGLRAYLKVPAGNTISYVAEIDGVATSLSEIDGGRLVQNTDTRVFNLQGQLVGNSLNGLQPGLYIQGGKKVVVK